MFKLSCKGRCLQCFIWVISGIKRVLHSSHKRGALRIDGIRDVLRIDIDK